MTPSIVRNLSCNTKPVFNFYLESKNTPATGAGVFFLDRAVFLLQPKTKLVKKEGGFGMKLFVCSCCFHPEVLDPEYIAQSRSIPFVALYRNDNNPGYFIIEAGDNPPIFRNEFGVKKLSREFLLAMGYEWEETSPAKKDPQTGHLFNPSGWWIDPSCRKARLKVV